MQRKREQKRHEMDMTQGSILKKMLLFAVPLIFSGILQLLFNAADIIVVGRFAGDNSMAAVGATASLINLLTNLFIGLSIGSSVLVARYFGAKEEEALRSTVHTSILLSIISGVILTIVGVIGAEVLLTWMKTPGEVLTLATVYLRIYFIGMPAMMVYNFGSAILRAVGDTQRPLNYLLLAGVINVVLNLIFVIVFHMDVAGVALATTISQCVAAFLVLRCLVKETGAIHLDFKALRMDKARFLRIVQIGLPAGFQGVVFSLANVVIQSSVNLFGETLISGNSAAANLEGFVYIAMNAFYQSSISFTSQNVGAGKYERINPIMKTAMCCVTVVGLALGNGMYFIGNQLLGLYSNNPEVVAAGMIRLSIIFPTYCLCGMMDTMVGVLRGLGYSVVPMIVSLLGACALRLVWLATVFQMEEYHNPRIIYLSYPISWVVTLLVHLLCFAMVRRKLKKQWGV